MTVILMSIVIFVLAFAGMAVGLIVRRRCGIMPCHGSSNSDEPDQCMACGACTNVTSQQTELAPRETIEENELV